MTDLAPIPEETAPADLWARSGSELADHHFNVKGRLNQSELERMEAEFLSHGGCIQEIPNGVSGETTSEFNNRIVAVNHNSKFSTKEQEEYRKERINKVYAADAGLVAMVKEHLPTAQTARQLCETCKCHADRLDRILRTYFEDDPKAAQFMRHSLESREPMIIREYPAIAGKMGLREAALKLHVSIKELKRVIALHRLQPAPTAAQIWNNPGRPATKDR